MQLTNAPIAPVLNSSGTGGPARTDPFGTGGFLNPDKIVSEFGVGEGMSVADFGSGAGYFTILLGRLVGENGRVYALDVQETALDSVRIKARAIGLKNIEMARANLEVAGGSGLSDNSQDMVLLANILFQSDKKAEIIREAKRILKNGGRIILIDWRLGTGGFGPPDEMRINETAMCDLVAEEGLIFEKSIDAGQFHYGISFVKS
ncbi:MAG: methyltransferase domain-containing protein [Pseudomonadota bacterium]